MTITALIPDLVVHYHARIVVATNEAATSVGRCKVPCGVPTTSTSGMQSGGSYLGAWGSRITDEDLDVVIR